ncbi:MAG: phosphoribosyltransferase [Actinobacteria bacterium]|uniref:Unannotated protein n=1 Tax=freshwater metagenome TaxID=449393 RepID=A0A6J7E6L4_9ZZZZ|nr:phosphoribosyltransferase [Actinomycetota bacterium]
MNGGHVFRDRRDAGQQLARALQPLAGLNPLVLALPRGGVPVADEVARSLHAPLDVLIVRKLGSPANPEYGFGAVGEGGVVITNDVAQQQVGVNDVTLQRLVSKARAEIDHRIGLYRESHPMTDVAGRTVIVVDDGLATGSTATAAITVLRRLRAGHIVLAVPTGSREAVASLRDLADEVVCLETPEWFRSVGSQYDDFDQTSDSEVVEILHSHAATGVDREVVIPIGRGVSLAGHLTVPPEPIGIVVFAHGSGSSRLSPRNTAVARLLQESGQGTLLFDLLTEDEAANRANVFDILLLSGRLSAATAWLRSLPGIDSLPLGYFGASTGAAAALVAASKDPTIAAVVSRGGRPDLAGEALPSVQAPTLLIVGGRDLEVLTLNRQAQARMRCPTSLEVVPGATHLFEEEGTLQAAARLARTWFTEYASALRASRQTAG